MRKYTLYLLISLIIFSLLSTFVFSEVVFINDDSGLYALESVKLSGDLSTNKLLISGTGEIIQGDDVKVYLFGPTNYILIKNLYVNMEKVAVSFDDRGYFFVVKDGMFSFQADMEIKTIGQLNLYVPGPLNKLSFDLKNGHAVGGEQYGLYNSSVVIQRNEKVETLTKGYFRYQFDEQNKFVYEIDYQAFGSTLGQQTLVLKNNEQVVEVSGALKWEQKGNNLIMDLNLEEATVKINGFFDTESLKIPLNEEKHDVLIESNPEKKITILTTAEEKDLSESPIYPTYNNARYFFVDSEDLLNIEIEDMELKESLSAAVDYSTNTFAITKKGVILGEMQYKYQNSGVDYLELNVVGVPLYASAANKPIKLTAESAAEAEEDGKLNLAFPKTEPGKSNYFNVVYYKTRPQIAFIDLVKLPIINTNLPISEVTTNVFIPRDLFVVYTFGAYGGSMIPSLFSIIVFLLVVGGLSWYLLKKKTFVILSIIMHIGLFCLNKGLFYLSLAVFLLILLIRFFKKQEHRSKVLKWVLAIIGIIVVIGFLISGVVMFFSYLTPSYSTNSVDYYPQDDYGYEVYDSFKETAASAQAMESEAPLFSGVQAKLERDDAEVDIDTTKKGVLPVKLEIPQLGNKISLHHYAILQAEDKLDITLLVAAGWLKYIVYLIALICGFYAFRMYKENQFCLTNTYGMKKKIKLNKKSSLSMSKKKKR